MFVLADCGNLKNSLREISNLVEFTGPRYSMALSKSYTDTRGVMKCGVSESVCVPDTSVVEKSGQIVVWTRLLRCVKKYTSSDS